MLVLGGEDRHLVGERGKRVSSTNVGWVSGSSVEYLSWDILEKGCTEDLKEGNS